MAPPRRAARRRLLGAVRAARRGALGAISVLNGLYGVNFPHIPGTDNPWGFPIFVAAEATVALLAVWYLRRQRL